MPLPTATELQILFNLVDNACKWAQSRVAVEVLSETSGASNDRHMIRILVDDDMTVLPDDLRELVLDDLPRAPADDWHLRLADVEGTRNNVARHAAILTQ